MMLSRPPLANGVAKECLRTQRMAGVDRQVQSYRCDSVVAAATIAFSMIWQSVPSSAQRTSQNSMMLSMTAYV